MKITRYINGKKIHRPISGDIVIENEVITGTIEKINSRLSRKAIELKNRTDINE